jgi:hypothetical protein
VAQIATQTRPVRPHLRQLGDRLKVIVTLHVVPKCIATDHVRSGDASVNAQRDERVAYVRLVIGEVPDGRSGTQELLRLAKPPASDLAIAWAKAGCHLPNAAFEQPAKVTRRAVQLHAIPQRLFDDGSHGGVRHVLFPVLDYARLVPTPGTGIAFDVGELPAPIGRVFWDLFLAHDEEIQIAVGPGLSASDRPEQQHGVSGSSPGLEGFSKPLDELYAKRAEALDERRRDVAAIEAVEICASRLSPGDDALSHQTVGGFADTVLGASTEHTVDSPSAELLIGAGENS